MTVERVKVKSRYSLAIACLLLIGPLLFSPALYAEPNLPALNLPSEASIFRLLPEIKAFRQWDSENSVPKNAVLFVGSSSINYWQTKKAFPDIAVINRGFGGATTPDVWHFYDYVIKPYQVRKIVLFIGTNDISQGRSSEETSANIRSLIERMLSDQPEVEVIYLAISPTKLRWEKWPMSQQVNKAVKEFAADTQRVQFLDTASLLLTQSGQPNEQLYVEDGLHLNQQGYALWQALLAPYLKP